MHHPWLRQLGCNPAATLCSLAVQCFELFDCGENTGIGAPDQTASSQIVLKLMPSKRNALRGKETDHMRISEECQHLKQATEVASLHAAKCTAGLKNSLTFNRPMSARTGSLISFGSVQLPCEWVRNRDECLCVPAGFKVAEGVHTEPGGAKEDAEQRGAERR